MTIYYRGPCVRITDKLFEIRCPVRRSYEIAEMFEVYVARGEPVIYGVPIGKYFGEAGTPAVAMAIVGWFHPMTMLLVVLVLVSSAAVWFAFRTTRARPLQLWALYRGEYVCLFQSRNRLEFGQVERGLRRAMENLDRW